MNKKTMKDINDLNSSYMDIKNEITDYSDESFVIPYEAACSPEFPEGCIIMEDEADMYFKV